jgi:outer membrane receptor protein involved in Fe transport
LFLLIEDFFKVQLMLKLLSALILSSSFVFPQNSDTLLIQDNKTNFDSTIVVITDSIITDTTKVDENTAKADSLIPIQGQPLTDVSTIISQRTFLFENYRYTGDLLRSFNLNFIKDLGFVGYPNETFIYGVGNGGISYMLDGVLWNNRYTNSLDLNFVQSEDIDSIEIVPSPRGFLYGPYGNPVTVNFITKDFIVPVPYARIKYYQGPDAEAMIDGRFSVLLAKRWNLSFEVTNRSIDSTYTNTAYSFWQVNTKLKYYLSNSVNLTAWYYYVDVEQGLNGGVNIDSVNNIPPSFNINMYSPEAPVVFPNQKLDVLQNNFGLRTLVKTSDASQLDLSLYYRYNLDETRNAGFNYYSLNLEYKTYGATLNYRYSFDFITLQLLGDYEKSDFQTSYSFDTERYNIGGIVTLNTFDKGFKFSLFGKYGYDDRINYNQDMIGLDLLYTLPINLSLYAGYSLRNQNFVLENVSSTELGLKYIRPDLLFNLKYFYNEFFNGRRFTGGPSLIFDYLPEKVSGLGLNFNYKYWLLLLETNTSYYFKSDDTNEFDPVDDFPVNLPRWQFVGGVYVTGLFFNDNLDLKTGFTFYYTGEINSSEYYWQGSTTVEPTNKLDFTLAGEIKKVAIFYFIWENLLYNEYYITPYYPMPDGNIRFGIAWELFN